MNDKGNVVPSRKSIGPIIEGGLRMVEMERWLSETHRGVHWRSLFDAHTGLPNRSLFADRLDCACRGMNRGSPSLAVLMLHFNDLEKASETHGNAFVEQLRIEAVHRIQPLFRETDSLARFDHNEFAALLIGAKSARDAVTVAERISVILRKPIEIDQHAFSMNVSIGIAVNPTHGSDVQTLLSNAAQAMRRAQDAAHAYEVHTALPFFSREGVV